LTVVTTRQQLRDMFSGVRYEAEVEVSYARADDRLQLRPSPAEA
jgi:hypothetical protein